MRGVGALLVPLLGLGMAAVVVSARHAVGESATSSRPDPRSPVEPPIAVSARPVLQTPHAPEPPAPPPDDPRFTRLKALNVLNVNSGEAMDVRLYDSSGHVDDAAKHALDRLLCDARDPEHPSVTSMDLRLLQLVYRSAYHFRAREVLVISAYRKPGRHREGLHALGTAIDYKLRSVPAAALAQYLRTLSRVGVGVYTNPHTQYVHLDVREHSYHWLDGSPPGRSWHELSFGERSLDRLDLTYRRADDWPEGTSPPGDRSEPNTQRASDAVHSR